MMNNFNFLSIYEYLIQLVRKEYNIYSTQYFCTEKNLSLLMVNALRKPRLTTIPGGSRSGNFRFMIGFRSGNLPEH